MSSGSLWWTGTTPEALTAGRSHNAAAGIDGAQPPPRLLRSVLSHRFVRISCGGAHAMALTHDGKLYAWGWNDHGQLGLGDATTTASAPRPVGFFTGRKVGAVACGAAHSVALVAADTDNFAAGTLCFSWGAHAAGQLGLPPKLLKNTAVPQEVEKLNGCADAAEDLPAKYITHASHMYHTCITHASHMHHTCITHASHMHHTCITETMASITHDTP
jgi:alpha-tubulin suppressor-like RCC1 family protein